MKKPLLLVAVSLLVLGLIPGFANSSHATGWSQAFQENGVGNFDWMEIYWISGSKFDTPAFSNFSDTTWILSYGNDAYAVATGDPLADLTFNIGFVGASSDPLSFDFLAWNGNGLADAAHADWNGSGWSITGCDPTGYNPPSASVPEPATALLLGSGLLSLACAGRKKTSRS